MEGRMKGTYLSFLANLASQEIHKGGIRLTCPAVRVHDERDI